MRHNGTFTSYISLFNKGIERITSDCGSNLKDVASEITRNTASTDSKCTDNQSVLHDCLHTRKKSVRCPHVLLDSTPRYFHSNAGVKGDVHNLGLKEPEILLPHRIKHWLPDSKLILILRNPTERLLSAYRYFQKITNSTSSVEHFHAYVVNGTNAVGHCMTLTSLKNCLYDFHLNKDFYRMIQHSRAPFGNVAIGIYYIYLREWLKIFPPSNIFIIRFDDYNRNATRIMEELLNFLNLEPYSSESKDQLEAMFKKYPVVNKSTTEPSKMWPQTREILEEFYKPHNIQLSKLLNDSRYLWT